MNTSSMVASFLVLLLAFPTVLATDFTVGDDSGWNQGVDYTTWTSGKSFKVGDNLVFKYGSLHQVDEVSESDYKSCSSSNTIKNYKDGDSKVPLTQTGKIYFTCPTPGHCSNGMKLEINVVAAGSGTPPTTPSGTPPTTPSGSPPTTPSGSPPTTPSGSTTPSTSPPPPKDSGAVNSVSSGISLLIGSIILAFLG